MSALPSAEWVAALTRFSPEKTIEAPPDWDEAVQFLARHGVASIAAYNLQYRMPMADVPEEAKDFLLGYLQGGGSDNVFKLMTLRDLLRGFGERKVILLDGASFADTLYPHIAFRVVPEIRLLVREEDLKEIVELAREERFVEMEAEEPDPDRPAATLYNDKFFVHLYTRLLPKGGEQALFERAAPAKVFGKAAHRLQGEDALLVHVLSMARRAFRVPLIFFVDLRELVLGDSPVAFGPGPGAPIDVEAVLSRASELGVEKALWCGMELLARLQPDVEEKARSLTPSLGLPARAVLEKAVVQPALDLGKERQLRGLETLVRLLVE